MKTVKIRGNLKITTEVVLRNSKGEYNWLFNFQSGGFNSVWAKTLKQAIKKAETEFSAPVNPKSFEIATVASREAQDRMGYMMTC